MLVWKVLRKKIHYIGPVMVEGKFFKKIGKTFRDMFTWLDRKIGYAARCVMFRKVKVNENQILFFPFQHMIACNLKYISEELIRRKADVEIYWAVATPAKAKVDVLEIMAKDGAFPDKKSAEYKELSKFVQDHVHIVKANTYEYFQAVASSKIIFINSLLGDKFYPFPTKKEQIILQTWHGSLGIKRFDLAHYHTNLSWPEAAVRMGKLTTYCISNSTFEEAVFRETFFQKTPILRLGHARNDIFFPQFKGTREYLRRQFLEQYDLPEDVHFAMYGPTFRDAHNFEVYDLDANRTVRALEKRFGGDWRLLLRYHDNDKKNSTSRNTVASEKVINVTSYPDMQELLAFTDVAITDYSSWIYDYVLMRKPGFIFAMDKDEYNNERGFYFTLEQTPFPVATDSFELEDAILHFDEDLYQKRVEEFLAGKGCMDDGNAAERIADAVVDFLAGKEPEEKIMPEN